jgi:hypothetical protein
MLERSIKARLEIDSGHAQQPAPKGINAPSLNDLPQQRYASLRSCNSRYVTGVSGGI